MVSHRTHASQTARHEAGEWAGWREEKIEREKENVNDSERARERESSMQGDRLSSCIQFNSQLILTLTACGSSKEKESENATFTGKMRREREKEEKCL